MKIRKVEFFMNKREGKAIINSMLYVLLPILTSMMMLSFLEFQASAEMSLDSLNTPQKSTKSPVAQPLKSIPIGLQQKLVIRTAVNGIDHIQLEAIFLEQPSIVQLEAVREIVNAITLLAQQRFELEKCKFRHEKELECLHLIKSFALLSLLIGSLSILSFLLLIFGFRTISGKSIN